MLPFIEAIDPRRACVRDDRSDGWTSYGELAEAARGWQSELAAEKSLVFLYAHNDIPSVAALLGALAAGHSVALLDPKLPEESKAQLASKYRPEFVIDNGGPELLVRANAPSGDLHPQLALMLSTSGSTGSPKFVRLTLDNVRSNADAIADVLAISSESVAGGHLPIHYSFGLSVLTSHLAVGARTALTERGFVDRDFWAAMKDAKVTHLPGVPFHFTMLEKLGYSRLNLPQLRSMAQAGGHLDVSSRERAHSYMEQRGGRFFVMYGQTEAAPRITTLRHEDFPAAPASVGEPLSGGRIEIRAPDQDGRGEVVYHGPNVMMGYAETRPELAKGDELRGVLHTGDIGFLDEAGRLTLTGRAKRSAKVYGLRVNLDEVEALTNTICRSAVVQSGNGLLVFHQVAGGGSPDELRQALLSRFSLPATSFTFRQIEELPTTERGKIDYQKLGALS